MIPEQLRNNDAFRYVVINSEDGKAPLYPEWYNKFAFPANHFMIQNAIKSGRNIGIIGGYGGLLVIDIDNPNAEDSLLRELPKTYMHRSGGRGLPHLFYIVDEAIGFTIKNPENNDLVGDVRGVGGQVIIPPSKNVTTGNPYTIVNNEPITHTTLDELRAAVETAGFVTTVFKKSSKHDITLGDYSAMLPNKKQGFRSMGGAELIGAHPVHGSTTGHNLAVNTNNGYWYCFRCSQGGGVYSYRLMIEHHLSCEDAVAQARQSWEARK